jgi:hypothetical protein
VRPGADRFVRGKPIHQVEIPSPMRSRPGYGQRFQLDAAGRVGINGERLIG